ncbi:hypothetical protein N431DRAFT_488914 [Stipitochalara longipes BDJ]|nr:hypothetical protein N431DRAFT_488914 [Stipitochalara longipes BDJ]
MHFSTAVKLFLLASGATAFTIPEGQANGVYAVSYAEDGTELHELIGAPSTADPATIKGWASGTGHAKDRRQIPGISNSIGCGGYELNHGDTDSAAHALDAQCGGGASVGRSRDFYSLAGCSVWYFCNLAGQEQTCWASERVQAAAAIANQCGSYWAGWDNINNPQRNDQYGQEDNCGAGKNFCGRGTNGK